MKEYSLSKNYKILTFIVAPLLIGGFGYIGLLPFIKDYGLTAKIILVVVSIGLIFSVIMSVIEAVKTKLVIINNQFIKTRIFSTRILDFDEVEGFRVDENYIYILSNNLEKKNISIMKYFHRTSELIRFLDAKYTDLDELESEKEVDKLLNNRKFGKTEQDVITKITEMKRLTKPLNWIAAGFALVYLFYPFNYELLTIVNIIIPAIGIIIVLKGRGLIHIFSEDNSPYPTLNTTLTFSPGVLAIRALKDYDIFSYNQIWMPVILLSGFLMYLFVKYLEDEFKLESKVEKLIIYPLFSAVIGLYLFFAIIQLNCTFDNSNGTIFETSVLSKKISKSGKGSISYVITVAEWASQCDENEVKVTKKQYDELSENDKVHIRLRDGLLGVSWYYISSK